MAKAKVTRKWVASYYTCYGTGYCDLVSLLYFQSKDFYTCGVYGWNFDVYTFGDYAITTGYRGMISHIERDFALDREYNEKARAILDNKELSYEEKKTKVNALLEEFLEKVFDEKIRVY